MIKYLILILAVTSFAVAGDAVTKKPLSVKQLINDIKISKNAPARANLLEKIKIVNPNIKENLKDLLEGNKEKYEPGGIVDAVRGVYTDFSNRELIPVLKKYLKDRNPKVVFGSVKFLEILNRQELLKTADCEDLLIKLLKRYYTGMQEILKTRKEYPVGNIIDTDEEMISYSIFWNVACSMKILGDLGTEKSIKIIEKYILLEDNNDIDEYLMHALLALSRRGVKNIAGKLEHGPGQEESWKQLKKKFKETYR